MSRVMDIPILLGRQALATAAAAAATSAAADDAAPESCSAGNDYDGRIGVRISALFVILITSSLGVLCRSSHLIMGLTRYDRSCLPSLCCSTSTHRGAGVGLFHCKVLWIRGDHCYSIYTRQ